MELRILFIHYLISFQSSPISGNSKKKFSSKIQQNVNIFLKKKEEEDMIFI